jgi:uncharacterized protein YbjT (DUF2867 family)
MELSKGDKTALVFGATGLVGGFLTDFLLMHPSYKKVKTFGRNPLDKDHSKLENLVVDLNDPQSFSHLVKGDDLFLCIGTTMAKAGSKEAFYKVDFEYNYNVASLAEKNGVNQCLLVSSVGADENSIFFYSEVKGKLENAIKDLSFWSTHIFQPSLLLGERNENRWGEEVAGVLGRVINRFTGGLLNKYKPVEADVVAKAMVEAAQKFESGIHIYPSHYLQELAEETDRMLREG